MPELNIIFPESLDLSLAAIGVLSTMLNDPEKDYCTMSELYKTIPVDSLPTLSMALAELLDKHYLMGTSKNLLKSKWKGGIIKV